VMVLISSEQRRAIWQGVRDRAPLKVALGGLALVTTVAWLAVLQLPAGRLKVTFLDVGQGDAIFIQTPGGVQVLVDGGPKGSRLLAELGRQMPFWDRTLDVVVLTHPEDDHVTGLISALERYDVGAVVAREVLPSTNASAAWQAALASRGMEWIRGEAGTRVDMSDGVTLEVLHPGPDSFTTDTESTNNDSVVMRLSYKDVAVLLTGDIEAEVEKELVRSGVYLRSTVLKVPHHGSDTSSCQDFLDAVGAQVAVISVGEDNRFGHPSDDVLARLQDNARVYRTDRNGSVSIASDGHRLWIETQR
jgi:competence protein ComEC